MNELIPTQFDNSGTNNLPLNCGWMLGKINANRKGRKHIHKIGECFYDSFINRRGKKFWTFRCKSYRDGCTWKMKMIPKDLEKFRKLKVSSRHLVTLMSLPDEHFRTFSNIHEHFRFERFFELAFKMGNIHSPRLNELYEEQNPFLLNVWQDL